MKSSILLSVLLSFIFTATVLAQAPNNFQMNKGKAIQFYGSADTLDDTEIIRPGGNSLRIRYKNNPLRFEALDNKPFQIRNSMGDVNVQFNPNGGKSYILGKLGINTPDIEGGYHLQVAGNIKAEEMALVDYSPTFLARAEANDREISIRPADGNIQVTNATLHLNRYNANPVALATGGGNVGIGTANPTQRLEIASGNAVILGQGRLGLGTGSPAFKLDVIDDFPEFRIRAEANNREIRIKPSDGNIESANAVLQLNRFTPNHVALAGGGGKVGIGTVTPTGRLHIAGDPSINDASLTGPGGYLVLGNTDGPNLALDNNEIMARNNGMTTTLGLQADGGSITVHGGSAIPESEKVHISGNGNVGIGTTPSAKLHIAGGGDAGLTNEGSYILLGNVSGTNLVFDDNEIMARNNGGISTLNLQADGGIIAIHANDFIPESEKVIIREDGSVGIGINGPAAKLHIIGAENNGVNGTVKISTNSQTMILDANEIDAMSDGLYLNNNTMHNVLLATGGGKVGIGTSTIPSGYKLAVNGKIISTEVKVQNTANWPDYVFNENYELMPLAQLEESIQQNGHLPGIPSAAEVEANGGVEVGDMQRRLLEKVEELTLYIIQLEKRIQEMEQK